MSAGPSSDARTRLPRHVAVIMDGNGRWAEKRGLPRLDGHREGAVSVRDVVRAARQVGLEAITLYAFSAQNWGRPADEVAGLMDLLRDYLVDERPEIMENDIRLRAIGDIDKLPHRVREVLDSLMADSGGNRTMVLTLALSYGGRESIVEAVRRALESRLDPARLDEEQFGRFLPTSDLPPLDLVIRTSGELRISNFLLWEAAYAELYFSNALWPDFRRQDLYAALDAYAQRERRFGLTGSQIESGGDLAPDLLGGE
jgi:undecaprenyl diphosphate synthase